MNGTHGAKGRARGLEPLPRRVFSVVLSIAFALSLSPAAGLAVGSEAALLQSEPPVALQIAGVPITEANAADIFGDGTASYDAASHTLTLENFAATGNDADPTAPMLSAPDSLTLKLKGENALVGGTGATGIYVQEGQLMVEGDGSLAVSGGYAPDEADSYGIYVKDRLFIRSSFTGTLVATGGAATAKSAGISSADSVLMYGGTVIATGGNADTSAGISVNKSCIVCKRSVLVAQGGNGSSASYGILNTDAQTGDRNRFDGGFVVARAGLVNGALGANGRQAISGTVTLSGTKVVGHVGWSGTTFSDAVIRPAEEAGNLSVYTGVVIAPRDATQASVLGSGGSVENLTSDVYRVTTDGTNFGSNITMPELTVNMNEHTALFVNLNETTARGSLPVGYAMNVGAPTIAGVGSFVGVGGIATHDTGGSTGLYFNGVLTVDGPDVIAVGGPVGSGTSFGIDANAQTLTAQSGQVVGVGGVGGDSQGIRTIYTTIANGSAQVLGVGGIASQSSYGINRNGESNGTAVVMGVGGQVDTGTSMGIYESAASHGGIVFGIGGSGIGDSSGSCGVSSGIRSDAGGKVVALGGVTSDISGVTSDISYGCYSSYAPSETAGDLVVAGRKRSFYCQEGSESFKYASGATATGFADYLGGETGTAIANNAAMSELGSFKRVVVEPTRYLALGVTEGGAYTHDVGHGASQKNRGSLNTSAEGGQAVTLTAYPDEGYEFKGWYEGVIGESSFVVDHTDTLVSADAAYTFTPTSDMALQAVFEAATSIAGATVTAPQQTFTGAALTPAVTVTLGGRTLKAGTDYTVSYKNNVAVGTATVTVTGKGSYAGTATGRFAIAPASLAKATVTAAAQTYTGKALTPAPKVVLGGKTLKAGSDYAVAYKNNVEVGTATVTVTGKGNYTGTATGTFAISAAPAPGPEPEPQPKAADTTALKAAIASVPADLSPYTDESAAAVTKAKEAAEALLGATADQQAKVDAAAKALNDAVKALEEKPAPQPQPKAADTEALKAAIASVPADLSPYTDESAAAVTKAKEAAEALLSATADQQAKVDAAAKALSDAVKALEQKPAPEPEPGPTPAPDSAWTRLAGDDRFGTMQAITLEGYESAGTVLVATGIDFADALAAAGLSGVLDAPIVTTMPGELSAEAKDAITELGAKNAIILGGTSAVSADVEKQLKAMGLSTSRLAGDNRVDTAVRIWKRGGSEWGDTCILSKGWVAADALAAGSFAYADSAPLFLALPDGTLTPDTAAAVKSFDHVVVLGGTAGDAAISDKTAGSLGVLWMRVAGDTRYETATALATWASGNDDKAAFQPEVVLSWDDCAVAFAWNYPDALVGVNVTGPKASVTLLASTDVDEFTQGVADAVKQHADEVTHGYVLGGTSVVSDGVKALFEKAAK